MEMTKIAELFEEKFLLEDKLLDITLIDLKTMRLITDIRNRLSEIDSEILMSLN